LTLQEGKVGQLLDPSLSTESYADQIERLILAASLCIRRAPQSRPHITMVKSFLLNGIVALIMVHEFTFQSVA
jgi:hypothetical protein